MTKLKDLNSVHTAIEGALTVSVQEVQVPGIADAALRSVAVSSQQLQQVVAQLEQHGHLLDVMVTEGKFIRRWSQEKNDYVYCLSDPWEVSRFAV